MKKKQEAHQWVNLPLTKNGLIKLSGKLLRVAPLNEAKTNPSNAPRYKLLDLSKGKAEYLSGLYDNGDHYGGDIAVGDSKYRFKIRVVGEALQGWGLTTAIQKLATHSAKTRTQDIDPLQGFIQANKSKPKQVQNQIEITKALLNMIAPQ